MTKHKKTFESEEALASYFLKILKALNHECWCEVEALKSRIDIVSKDPKTHQYYTWHLKMALSNKVLEQAAICRAFDTVNIAVIPGLVRGRVIIDDVKRSYIELHNLGVLTLLEVSDEELERRIKQALAIEENIMSRVAGYTGTYIRYPKKPDLEKKKLSIEKLLYDSQKSDRAGYSGGGYDTAFKRSLRYLADYYKENEFISFKDTWDKHRKNLHWKSYGGFVGAFNKLKDLDIVKEAAQYMSKKEGANNERTDNN